MGRYVQYGCGFHAPVGWENYDASPTLRFERIALLGRLYTKNANRFPANVRYGDIVKGLPVEPESCAGVYCSHVLEHLTQQEALHALANTYLYLEPGGVFRLVVPDLRQLAQAYLAEQTAVAAPRFLEASGLGLGWRKRGILQFLRAGLGNSVHRWMWDEQSMTEALRIQGFRAIRRCHFGDAQDSRFREVEQESRFIECLAMECRK